MLKNLNLVKIYVACIIVFILVLFLAYLYTDPISSKEMLNTEIKADFKFILLNNLKVALLLIFLGPLTFTLGTFAVLVVNGLIIGSALGSIKNDFSLIVLLIPHGIIEVPILILAASIGVKMAFNLFLMKLDIRFLLKYLLIVLIGLIIAASIETFVTPIFIKGVL
ncbi:hypothetical protein SRCM101294_01928 [Bacillus amyloliquefaciens]|nr:hypothetical protein SRCM101294_01928 [Bacillus amyloliquefaciens]